MNATADRPDTVPRPSVHGVMSWRVERVDDRWEVGRFVGRRWQAESAWDRWEDASDRLAELV